MIWEEAEFQGVTTGLSVAASARAVVVSGFLLLAMRLHV